MFPNLFTWMKKYEILFSVDYLKSFFDILNHDSGSTRLHRPAHWGERERDILFDLAFMPVDEGRETVPWVFMLTQCTGLLIEILCDTDKERCVKQSEQKRRRGRNVRGQLHDWLPVKLSPLAACLWRLQHCRKPWRMWVYCHWHQWPGCWQLLDYSAGRHLMPPSKTETKKQNTRQRDGWWSFWAACSKHLVKIWEVSNLHIFQPSQSLTLCLCACLFFIPSTLEKPVQRWDENVCLKLAFRTVTE